MADRGRKALPSSNRLTTDKWNNYCLELHYYRLFNMEKTPIRCKTMDTDVPKTQNLPHLKYNAKKQVAKHIRALEIARENKILMDKICRISKNKPNMQTSAVGGHNSTPFLYRSTLQLRPGMRVDNSQYPIIDSSNIHQTRSLNREQRIRDVESITLANFAMLKRIKAQKPKHDRIEWKREWRENQKYMANARRQDVQHLAEKLDKLEVPEELQYCKGIDSRPQSTATAIKSDRFKYPPTYSRQPKSTLVKSKQDNQLVVSPMIPSTPDPKESKRQKQSKNNVDQQQDQNQNITIVNDKILNKDDEYDHEIKLQDAYLSRQLGNSWKDNTKSVPQQSQKQQSRKQLDPQTEQNQNVSNTQLIDNKQQKGGSLDSGKRTGDQTIPADIETTKQPAAKQAKAEVVQPQYDVDTVKSIKYQNKFDGSFQIGEPVGESSKLLDYNDTQQYSDFGSENEIQSNDASTLKSKKSSQIDQGYANRSQCSTDMYSDTPELNDIHDKSSNDLDLQQEPSQIIVANTPDQQNSKTTVHQPAVTIQGAQPSVSDPAVDNDDYADDEFDS